MMETLKPGRRGADVLLLQQRLNEVLECGLEEDSIYGAKTKAATAEYQKTVGLTVDGLCGVKTATSLDIKEKIEEIQSRTKVILDDCPNYKQYQQPWADKPYPPSKKGWTHFRNAACGCLTAVNAVLYYDLDLPDESTADTVYRVAEDAAACGARQNNRGTSAKIFDRNGLHKKAIKKNQVEAAIDAGHPVALCVKNGWASGDYRGNGHWILLYGYSADSYYIRDVGSGKSIRAVVNKKDWIYVKQAYELFKD